ncbi:hypothetical protein GQX74_000401 [Glossina fuscipes]|nr:hypothetical protein GQX74_000401 [Glossina fuscipes]
MELFPWKLFQEATTASCGSSGSGASNRTCNDNRTVRKLIAAAQLSFKISRQMAPVADDIFGCQILVIKRTFGGTKGVAKRYENESRNCFGLLSTAVFLLRLAIKCQLSHGRHKQLKVTFPLRVDLKLTEYERY